MRKLTQSLLFFTLASLAGGYSSQAAASAFQLFEQNAVSLGDFGAGGAAIAEDASTAYYNPAGLVRIPTQQIVLSLDAVDTYLRFNGTNTWQSTDIDIPAGYKYTETGSTQGGGLNWIPAFHYALPLNNQFVFGFSVAYPFGLETNYAESSVLRYSATETQLQVMDISPSLGFKLTDKFSAGLGIDFERLSAILDSVAGLPPENANIPTAYDSQDKNDGSGWGTGFHLGFLYQFTPATRVGLAYRSMVHINLSGTSQLAGPLAGLVTGSGGVLNSNNLSTSINLPPTTTLSGYHDINNRWAVDGSINYTQWSIFNNTIRLHHVQGIMTDPATGVPIAQDVTVNLVQNFHDSWRLALGTQFKATQKWLLRAGVGYDQSPVPNADRNVRLPDGNRIALALGTHYQFNKALGMDAGWTHLFIQNVGVSTTLINGTEQSTANGSFSNHADLVGAQLVWNIG